MGKKRVYHTAETKLKALADKRTLGASASARKHNLSSATLLYQWEANEAKLLKEYQRELRENGQASPVHAAPIAAKAPSQPAPPPSAKQAITGLGALIGDVRTVVIEELAEELGDKLAEIVDQRMPEIVARELRKLLTEQQKQPASSVQELRPVAKRA